MGRCQLESPCNRITVCTVTMATNILLNHPDKYDFVILDEFHEVTPELI